MMNGFALPEPFENLRFLFRSLPGNNQGNVFSNGIVTGVAKHGFGGFVPTDDNALERFADDGILGSGHDRSQLGLGFFGPFTFNELAELPAQGAEQLDKILFG